MPTQQQKRLLLSSQVVTPAQINGLTVWYKADTLVLSDNDPVSTWFDSGNGGINVSQATGSAKPTYKSNSGPNGKPTVAFDGGDALTAASVAGTSLCSANQCHIFIVQKQTGSQARNTPINWNAGVGNILNVHATYDDTLYFDLGNQTSAQGRVSVAQPAAWDDNWRLVQCIREAPNSGTAKIRVQQSQLVSGSVTTTLTIASTATLIIGSQASITVPFLGSISEIIMYNVALSDNDRLKIEAYLNKKYNLF